ncbi:hypothetical protein V8C35DRAFT_133347 [Trichoderma chlorosporum]
MVDAKTGIRNNTAQVFKSIDRKLVCPRVTEDVLDTELEAIQEKLYGSLIEDGDTVQSLCDYTGREVSWSAGPRSWSIEAIYPYIISDGRVAYHAAENVCTLSTVLNWVKGRNTPLQLALLSAWIDVYDDADMDFQQRKGKLAWVFNALANESLMARLSHLMLPHKDQVDQWTQWGPTEQRHMLEMLRTGIITSKMNIVLAAHEGKDIFPSRKLNESKDIEKFRRGSA